MGRVHFNAAVGGVVNNCTIVMSLPKMLTPMQTGVNRRHRRRGNWGARRSRPRGTNIAVSRLPKRPVPPEARADFVGPPNSNVAITTGSKLEPGAELAAGGRVPLVRILSISYRSLSNESITPILIGNI
jgi:hypothetical protein